MKDYQKISEKYIKDVLKGTINSCKWVKLAVKRQLDDLERQKSDTYPYYYNKKYGEKVCFFLENLKHYKGEFANRKFKLSPWQVFFTMTLFSWLYKSDNLRRFREFYQILPRKGGKTLWVAGVGLYMMLMDGEVSAEVYTGATSKRQAHYVFDAARQMIKNNLDLKSYFNIDVNKETIINRDDLSIFEPVIRQLKDGANVSFGICDEVHQFTDTTLIDALSTGMGSRKQPMIGFVSTVGVDTTSPLYERQQNLEKILEGIVDNDSVFGMIWTIDDGDDWKSIKNWYKANPNAGITPYKSFLKEKLKEAIAYPSRRNIIKTKHLNIWQNTGVAFIDLEKFLKCKNEDLNINDFKDKTCFMAIDLASKIDLASVVKVFPLNDKYYVFTNNYLPSETVEKPENDHYRKWREEGYLTVTDGVRTDYTFIEEQIMEDIKLFDVKEIIFDPHEASYLVQRLQTNFGENSEVELVEFNQSPSNFNAPIKEFEASYLDGEIVYGNDPILEWCASNAIIKNPNYKLWSIGKQNRNNKIDTFIALIMAFARAYTLEESTTSVYESRGMLII